MFQVNGNKILLSYPSGAGLKAREIKGDFLNFTTVILKGTAFHNTLFFVIIEFAVFFCPVLINNKGKYSEIALKPLNFRNIY